MLQLGRTNAYKTYCKQLFIMYILYRYFPLTNIAAHVRCRTYISWRRHPMETFSALLAICARNSPVLGEFPGKGQLLEALMFSLICVWINDWVNDREAGDLRRYRAHYDVLVMCSSALIGTGLYSQLCIINRSYIMKPIYIKAADENDNSRLALPAINRSHLIENINELTDSPSHKTTQIWKDVMWAPRTNQRKAGNGKIWF